MAIEKINFSYPKGTLQSVFDAEELTALELASKTSKKVDECVEMVNGVEQSAIEATAVVDEMRIAQDQFITENNDIRQSLVVDNQTFIDGLELSQTTFETNMTTELNTFKDGVNASKTTFETELNTSKTTFETELNTSKTTFENNMSTSLQDFATSLNNSKTTFENNMSTSLQDFATSLNTEKQTYIDNANDSIVEMENVTLPLKIEERLDIMAADGSLGAIINDELLGETNRKIDDLHVNVKDLGAIGDGTTDDSIAIQSAIDTGRDVFIPEGTYLCNIKLTTKSSLVGAGQEKTKLKSFTPNGYAITVKRVIPDWVINKISNLSFEGDGTSGTRCGVSYGETPYAELDEYAGRIRFEHVTFRNLNIGVHKKYGNIGNAFDYCNFYLNNYGYMSEYSSKGMHGGCDTFYKCEFDSSVKAAIYIDSPQSGTGMTVIRDTIIELNQGFGVFINSYNDIVWSPAFIFDNVWFEGNATSPTVTINSIVHTPKDIYMRNCGKASMRETNIYKIELISSILIADNCSTGDNNADVKKDANSLFISQNANFFKNANKNSDFYNSNIINGSASAGNSARFFTKPRTKLTKANKDNQIISTPFTNDTYIFVGDKTRTATLVKDGVLFDGAAELTVEANGTALAADNFTVPANKYIVWSIDVKLVSGTPPALVALMNSGQLSPHIPITDTSWKSYVGLTNTIGMSSFTSRLYIIADAEQCTFRVSALQVMAFDKLEDAMRFIDGGLYQLPAEQPSILYADAPPINGIWNNGDIIYNNNPTIGEYVGWIYTSTGWKGFGVIGETQ